MPNVCWFEPSDHDKAEIRALCSDLVFCVNKLEEKGDPVGYNIEGVKKMIDHLYVNQEETKI